MKHVSPFVRPFLVAGLAAALCVPLGAATAAAAGGPAASAVGGPVGQAAPAGSVRVVFSQTETDLATGDSVTESTTEERDNRGRVVRVVDQTVTGDGTVLRYSEVTTTYGDGDGAEQTVFVVDEDGDGPAPASVIVSTSEFDNRGRVTGATTTYDYDGDGTVDATEHDTFTLDKKGRETSVHLDLTNGPGPEDDETLDVTLVYGKHGQLTSITEDLDRLATPQSPDTRRISTSEYDGAGRVQGGEDLSYELAEDGTETLVERSTFSVAYERGDLVASDHSETDVDGDGTVDSVRDSVYGYDSKGNQVSQVSTTVEGGVTTVNTFTQSFGKRGNFTGFVDETTVDGVVQYRTTLVVSFDKRGAYAGSVYSTDEDGDGVVDYVEREVVTGWDSRGRVTSVVITEEDGSGTVLSRAVGTVSYTQDTETQDFLHDDDADGTDDRRVVTVLAIGD